MSADQETRLWLTMLRDYIAQEIRRALPFVRDGKLDLSSKNIVGTVPPANGGSGTNTGSEPALGNPAVSGEVLSSTTAGVRSWVAQPSLTVDEGDGAPSVAGVTHLTVSNGTLTDNGSGHVTVTTGGGGGSLTVAEADGTPSVSGVTSITVSNGTLTDDGGGAVTLTTSGGGGGSITSGTYASRPAAGTAGALYLATDVPMLYRDTGSTWERYPLREVIATQPPAASGFTGQNAGTATLTDDADGLLYSYAKGTTGGDLNCRGFTVAAPATPWTWTIQLRAYIHCGSETDTSTSATLMIGGRESSTGKRTVVSLTDYQYHSQMTFDHWAGDASYGAGVGTPTPPWGGWHNCPPLRVKDDGTTLSLQLSYDGGRNWYTIYSEARTSYMAGGANQLYIGGRITGNAVAANAIVVARIEGWSVA